MKGLARSLGRARGAGNGQRRVLGINFRPARTLAIVDPGAAVAFASLVVGDFPEGNILYEAAVGNLKFTRGDTGIITTFAGNVSLGTTATADATLTGTDADMIATTALVTGVAGVSAANRIVSTAALTNVIFDNTDGSLEVNLNVTIADASITATSSLIIEGFLKVLYTVMLDD